MRVKSTFSLIASVHYDWAFNIELAQSARAVEYTDSTSADG